MPKWMPTSHLKWHRLRLGLSQPELAARIGVNVKKVVAWERWQAEPSAAERDSLAAALSCPEETLMHEIPPVLELKVPRRLTAAHRAKPFAKGSPAAPVADLDGPIPF